MKKLMMYRKQLDTCSTGFLIADEIQLHSIERPWITSSSWPSGKPNVSCVPYGIYKLVPHSGTKFEDTVALVNHKLGVHHQKEEFLLPSDRWGILIHVGNWAHDVSGCIALGTGPTYLSKTNLCGVGNSRKAMQIFNGFIKEYTHLVIKRDRRKQTDRAGLYPEQPLQIRRGGNQGVL